MRPKKIKIKTYQSISQGNAAESRKTFETKEDGQVYFYYLTGTGTLTGTFTILPWSLEKKNLNGRKWLGILTIFVFLIEPGRN